MKIIPPQALKQHSLCADIIDTHITEWQEGDRFERFKKRYRPFSGLLFILSDMEMIYKELDEHGHIISQTTAKKGDILYIPKNVRYDIKFYLKHGQRRDTYTVNFNLYTLHGNEVLFGERIFLLDNKVNPFMTEDLMNLHKRFHNPIACDKLHISSLFFSILYYATKTKGESKASDAIKLAVDAIEKEYNKNERIEKYAQMCHMSPTYFYQEFRALTGMSPIQYRNHIRINVAKSDIHNTDMTIKEIAVKVGISDEFYFSRLFKRITGISPKQFKQG